MVQRLSKLGVEPEQLQLCKSINTCVAEFFATDRPILTTNVPNIPHYLTPRIHADIVSDDTSQALQIKKGGL